MLDCGAVGDGVTDNTAALQTCLDQHAAVFLPRGIFRTSATLSVGSGRKFVGLSQTHSVIAPLGNFSASNAKPAPLIRVGTKSNGIDAQLPEEGTTLAFIGLTTWYAPLLPHASSA